LQKNDRWLALPSFVCYMVLMGVDDFRPLGAHSYRIEGDLLFFRMKGVVSLADMIEILRLTAEVKMANGAVFTLYDSRENTGLEPAARKYATDHGSEKTQVAASASFGAPFAMRVVVNMLNRANGLLHKTSIPTMLFNTEAEARAYLQAAREEVQAMAT